MSDQWIVETFLNQGISTSAAITPGSFSSFCYQRRSFTNKLQIREELSKVQSDINSYLL